MNRLSTLSLLVVCSGIAVFMATAAESQVGPPKAYVNLQPTTPGSSQSGNINVSGTVRAGQHVGGGAGLTNVNAATLAGLPASAFLQSVPVPLVLTGATGGQLFRAQNTDPANGSTAVYGLASASSGVTYGVRGDSNSPSGIGVYALVNSTTGSTEAGHFETLSSSGIGVVSVASSSSGFTYGGNFVALSSDGVGIVGYAASTTGNNRGVYGRSDGDEGTGVTGEALGGSGETFGGSFISVSNEGYGVRAIGGKYGVHGTSSDPLGLGAYGGYFEAGSNGTGVFGQSATGGAFYSTHPSTGIGVRGTALGTGVSGQAMGTVGEGVSGWASAVSGNTRGVYGRSDSDAGSGVFGEVTPFAGTGSGVRGKNASTTGSGVYGEALNSTGVSYGGRFVNASPQGYGAHVTGIGPDALFVQNTGGGRGILVTTNSDTALWTNTTSGFASLDARNAKTTGYGVLGWTTSNTGVNYGVAGQTSSPVGWGVYAFGNLGASGVKPFRIDHPSDPENKYLLHYASESPKPQNFYLGNVTTDEKGYAWVELPAYFGEINANFKYQLTIVDESDSDDFIWAKVVRKVENNRFRIRTNRPGVEVSWRIDADRNDPYVRAYPTKDVVEKEGREKGTYQHPELYGMPKERGMNFRPNRS